VTPAYEVLHETFRLGEDAFDGRILLERGVRAVSWCLNTPPDIETVVLVGDVLRLSQADYPVNPLGWPIVSERFWEALGRPGAPLAVKVRETPNGLEVLQGRFLVFHLPPAAGLFDRAASIWEEDSVFPGEIGLIRELRLRAPLPSVFRIAEAPGRLFVSRDRRLRLLDSPCIGVRFAPVRSG
jgi:hypothetical protein